MASVSQRVLISSSPASNCISGLFYTDFSTFVKVGITSKDLYLILS